ncbi:MAG: hypothetical protein SV186_01290 [Candidatus Nanohaloarchaea archaeon]|nr:hypothetical protein [Candidatus Nanohaloarchaea archaeon]
MDLQQEDGAAIEINRKTLGIAAVIAILAVAIYLMIPSEPTVVERSDRGYRVYSNGEVAVNNTYIVRNQGWSDYQGEFNINYGRYMTTIQGWGVYNGTAFYDDVFVRHNRKVMAFTNRLDPDDGVMQGYLAPRMMGPKENPRLRVDIYLDQDFREQLDNVSIMWGPRLSTATIRPYQFNEVAEGVYMDTIYENDTRRFTQAVSAAAHVYVGEVFREMKEDGEGTLLLLN